MSGRETDGRAESIRQRLRNELRARGEDVTLGLQRYVVERFLYRLGRSRHRTRFVLKGATLFAIWGTAYRPTRDIDFTGYGSSKQADVIRDLREICGTPDEVDQLVFDSEKITAEPIRDGSEYDGLRVRIRACLGDSDIALQIDVGFGNAIVPGPKETEYRTILGDPPPLILAYPRESVVAEKLNAMVTLGERNRAATRTSTTCMPWRTPPNSTRTRSCVPCERHLSAAQRQSMRRSRHHSRPPSTPAVIA